jgi:hypothetical protein
MGQGNVAAAVGGVAVGVFSRNGRWLDATALSRALPAERDTREGGFRDGLEAMGLALFARGIDLKTINAAAAAALDGYTNDA